MNDIVSKAKEKETPPVKTLIFFLENAKNIAEFVDEDQLIEIGRDALAGYESDEESMQDWVDIIEKGLDLIKPDLHPKDKPWPNSANFKSPIILDAAIRWGDRASSVLLQSDKFVRPSTVGKDESGEKLKKSQRVADYMNWQLNNQIKGWVNDQCRLIYDLPYVACSFKKIFFSREEQSIVSELISYPDFVVNHNATCLEKAPRFSHKMEFSKNTVTEKQRAGLWLDIELSSEDDENIEQAENDDISLFVEQQTLIDLDHDGYKEPYTIVFHKVSSKVLRIVPRFNVSKVLVKMKGINNRTVTLDKVIESGEDVSSRLEIVKIEPLRNIIKYGFIPNPDGGLLDIGYLHLLCGLNAGINSTTNSLINAGNLANLQGGWLAKGGRTKLGVASVIPGVYQQTDISAQDLQNSFRDYTFREPSPTLFQLNQFMVQTAKELSSSVDITSAIGANAPAATTLALVQEQQQSSGAIIQRTYRSESEEFKKIFELNREFLQDEDGERQYKEVLDDEAASLDDFTDNFDIIPAANPEASSKIQRLQLAQAEMSQIPAVQEAGGQIAPIVKSFYETIGSQNLLEIFPEPTEEEKQAQAQAEQEALDTEQAQVDFNNDALDRQVDVLEREQLMKEATAEATIEKTLSEVEKNEASTVKIIEEAETESLNNNQKVG